MKFEYNTPDFTVEIDREVINMEFLYPERDPDWTYTDKAGHHHDAKLATCEVVVTRTYWCEDCQDEHEESELRCKECGEVINPGTRTALPKQIPGLTHGTITTRDGKKFLLLAEDLAVVHTSTEDFEHWARDIITTREPYEWRLTA